MGGSSTIDPLCRFGKVASFAGAANTPPTLQDVERVDQHGQHQTLFA
jgi:hypothetical protein